MGQPKRPYKVLQKIKLSREKLSNTYLQVSPTRLCSSDALVNVIGTPFSHLPGGLLDRHQLLGMGSGSVTYTPSEQRQTIEIVSAVNSVNSMS